MVTVSRKARQRVLRCLSSTTYTPILRGNIYYLWKVMWWEVKRLVIAWWESVGVNLDEKGKQKTRSWWEDLHRSSLTPVTWFRVKRKRESYKREKGGSSNEKGKGSTWFWHQRHLLGLCQDVWVFFQRPEGYARCVGEGCRKSVPM